jgi:ubiquinone/menaquinone biosynthesis C-methylase UbiE
LVSGERVLDVACGSGNLAIEAAKAGADVTGIDIAANLIEAAKKRAAAEGLDIKFEEGDAEALPYEDNSFDTVVTMYGAMFAPRPDVTASELLRVTKPGGRIAMANWTPEGFAGQMFKISAQLFRLRRECRGRWIGALKTSSASASVTECRIFVLKNGKRI